MKKLFSIFITIAVLVLALGLAKNAIAKGAVEGGVKLVTGLKLKMDKLDVSLSKTYLGIESMKLYNPKGYEDKVMVDMPEIYVDYDLPAIMKGTVHLNEVRIHLEEFVVVKNKSGELNLDTLKGLQSEKEAAEKPKEEKPKGEAPEIQLDKLVLKVGKVVYKDYSKGGSPSVKTFDVNLNEEYSDITNPNKLVSLIVLKVMMNTPLAALTNFDVAGLKSGLTDTLASSQALAGEALGKATETLGKSTEEAEKLIGDASKSLKGAAGSLGDTASGLTGGLKEKTGSLTGGLKDSAGSLKEKVKLPFGKSN